MRPKEDDIARSLLHGKSSNLLQPSDILGVQVVYPMVIINLSTIQAKTCVLQNPRITLAGRILTLLDFASTPLSGPPPRTRVSIHGVFHSVPDSVVAAWVDSFAVRATPIERHKIKTNSEIFKHLRSGHRFCYISEVTGELPPRYTTLTIPHPHDPLRSLDIDLEVYCGPDQIVNCRRCKSLDHMSNVCPKIVCYACGKQGHAKANCRGPERAVRNPPSEEEESDDFSPQTRNSCDIINQAFNAYVRPPFPTSNRYDSLIDLESEPETGSNGEVPQHPLTHSRHNAFTPPQLGCRPDFKASSNGGSSRGNTKRSTRKGTDHLSPAVTSDTRERYNLRNRKRSLPSPELRTYSAPKKQVADPSQTSNGATPTTSAVGLPTSCEGHTQRRSSEIGTTPSESMDPQLSLHPVTTFDPLDLSFFRQNSERQCQDDSANKQVPDPSQGLPAGSAADFAPTPT
ncbi:hypothetical protein Bbelb_210770 [Branchiostoma belcheri]|nr:hypothetical protein Bbelb_210770 [Branchiostoma belcheri]